MKIRRLTVVGATFAVTFAYANIAAAQHEAHETKGDDNENEQVDKDVGDDEGESPEAKEERAKKEPKLNLGIDAVFGFGDVPALNAIPPTTLATVPSHTLENTHVASDSYIFAASYKITEAITLGARIPIVHASFGPEGLETQRGTSTVGNLEIWAAYEKKLTKKLAIIPELGIALPTAIGDELPSGDDVTNNPSGNFNNNGNDRFSALQAASAARGLEESALFETRRLGIIPKIELEYKSKRFIVAPYIKLENLISTSANNDKGYLGEIVGGFLAAYHVTRWFDAGVHAWVSAAFDKEDHANNALIVVEPQLRVKVGPLRPSAGLLLPVFPGTGPGNTYNPPQPYDPVFDARFVALRLALTGSF